MQLFLAFPFEHYLKNIIFSQSVLRKHLLLTSFPFSNFPCLDFLLDLCILECGISLHVLCFILFYTMPDSYMGRREALCSLISLILFIISCSYHMRPIIFCLMNHVKTICVILTVNIIIKNINIFFTRGERGFLR